MYCMISIIDSVYLISKILRNIIYDHTMVWSNSFLKRSALLKHHDFAKIQFEPIPYWKKQLLIGMEMISTNLIDYDNHRVISFIYVLSGGMEPSRLLFSSYQAFDGLNDHLCNNNSMLSKKNHSN